MDLRRRLAQGFAGAHPREAASVLESLPTDECVRVLRLLPPDLAAGVAQKMAPASIRRVLEELEADDAARILVELSLDTASSLLRRVSDECRARLLKAIDEETSRDLRFITESPAGSAGALMDPRAVAVPVDLTVEEAMQTVQKESQHAMYNVYVVDREGVLVGVINLQELLQAQPGDRLATIVRPAHHRLDASADRHGVLEHPGWRSVYSLPVVDAQDRFLGAVRYRTLRRLEGELREQSTNPATVTTAALGELFRTGIIGVVDALSGTVITPRRPEEPTDRENHAHREEPDHERDRED